MIQRFRADLAALVRNKIAAGFLPAESVGSAATGYGEDERCSVCDEKISGREVEYEYESVFHGTLRFHYDCFVAWRGFARASHPGSTSREG
jgi:hypothetical protein